MVLIYGEYMRRHNANSLRKSVLRLDIGPNPDIVRAHNKLHLFMIRRSRCLSLLPPSCPESSAPLVVGWYNQVNHTTMATALQIRECMVVVPPLI